MGMQEGVLESMRIFGEQFLGIKLLFLVNDSLMGPLDPRIREAWEQLKGPNMVSIGVWSNTIASGAGVAFTADTIQKKYFRNYWR
jgi:hypothetical protein